MLTRLNEQLSELSEDVRRTLPVLIIDDETDQASINTGGNRTPASLFEADLEDDDEEEQQQVNENEGTPPSRINGLIRQLIGRFDRSVYVGYTATPFANILIDAVGVDREAGQDLYPRDFFVDLPEPAGYFGAEAIFGNVDPDSGDSSPGMDIIREVPVEELGYLLPVRPQRVATFSPGIPPTLQTAMLDFVLAGAARRQRGDGDQPAAMLIHSSLNTAIQQGLTRLIIDRLGALRDEWRYARGGGIQTRLEDRWESEFRPLTQGLQPQKDIAFSELVEHIGPFLERIEVRQINSASEDLLDYEREPQLKAIVVGGNRLSRGLTIEGLLVSYYVRRSPTYDTLMQMGRWFGFRAGYEDLTRIFTTKELEGWFRDLAAVEIQLRRDLQVYENAGLTPRELGMRIRRYPGMLVTSRLKMKNARPLIVNLSYSGQLVQTTAFPLSNASFLENNLLATRTLLEEIGEPQSFARGTAMWNGVSADVVLRFLTDYRIDAENRTVSPSLLRGYIERQVENGELMRWTIAVQGRGSLQPVLGTLDIGITGGQRVNLIERTQLSSRRGSLGVITEPAHEEAGLDEAMIAQARRLQDGGIGRGEALRTVRPRSQGLLLLYPISCNSGYGGSLTRNRTPIYAERDTGTNLIGVALSFPFSDTAVEARGEFVVGTLDWRPV